MPKWSPGKGKYLRSGPVLWIVVYRCYSGTGFANIFTSAQIGSTFHSQRSRIHRPSNIFTYSHSLQQLRARKGGARGGKAGFATLSAFPLVPAHAKMVPLKGKVPTSQASPPERASPAFQASPRKGHHLRFMHPPGKGKHPPEGDQASVSSWNCGIGVTGG